MKKAVLRSLIVMLSLMMGLMVMGCDGEPKENGKEDEPKIEIDVRLNGKWYNSQLSGGFIFINGNYETYQHERKMAKGTYTTNNNIIKIIQTHLFDHDINEYFEALADPINYFYSINELILSMDSIEFTKIE